MITRRLVVPVTLGLVTLALSAASIQRADDTRACNPARVTGADDPSLRRVARTTRARGSTGASFSSSRSAASAG